MQPQQPYYSPTPTPPPAPTPYDFITNPGQPSKKPSLLGGGLNSFKLLVFVGGGALALGIILFIVVTIFGGSSINGKQLISLTQRQQEIIRVATLGSASGTSPGTRGLGTVTELTVLSDQKKALALMKTGGTVITIKELGSLQNANTTTLLTNAQASNTYNETFRTTLKTQLINYQTALKQAAPTASTTAEKTYFANASKNVALLLVQQDQL